MSVGIVEAVAVSVPLDPPAPVCRPAGDTTLCGLFVFCLLLLDNDPVLADRQTKRMKAATNIWDEHHWRCFKPVLHSQGSNSAVMMRLNVK